MAHIVTGVASFLGGFAQGAARHQRGREAISREERRHRETLALDEKRRREDIGRQNQQERIRILTDIASNSPEVIPPEALVELNRSLAAQQKGEGAGVAFAEGLSVLSRPKQPTPGQRAQVVTQFGSQVGRSMTAGEAETGVQQVLGERFQFSPFSRFSPSGSRGGGSPLDRSITETQASIKSLAAREEDIERVLNNPRVFLSPEDKQQFLDEKDQIQGTIKEQRRALETLLRRKGVPLRPRKVIEAEARQPRITRNLEIAKEQIDRLLNTPQFLIDPRIRLPAIKSLRRIPNITERMIAEALLSLVPDTISGEEAKRLIIESR